MDKKQKKEKLHNVKAAETIYLESIPTIDLYMDQVLTLLSNKLGDDEKTLTKTMINNYSKANLLPKSKNKKYSRSHIMLLIIIYHLKSFLSISDLELLANSILSDEKVDLSRLYGKFTQIQDEIREAEGVLFKEELSILEKPVDSQSRERAIESIFKLSLEANHAKGIAERLIKHIGE